MSQDYVAAASECSTRAIQFDSQGNMYKAKECYIAGIEYLKLAKMQFGKDKAFVGMVACIDDKIKEYFARSEQLKADIKEHGPTRPKTPPVERPPRHDPLSSDAGNPLQVTDEDKSDEEPETQDYYSKAAKCLTRATQFDEQGNMYKAKECYNLGIEYLQLAKMQFGKDKAFVGMVASIDDKIKEYFARSEQLKADIKKHGPTRPKTPPVERPPRHDPSLSFVQLILTERCADV
jgi:hypothetical protein